MRPTGPVTSLETLMGLGAFVVVWFSGAMTDLVLDLWGDVTDPWSYVAKRRVEAAIAASERPTDVVLVHHALPCASVSVDEWQRVAVAARPDGIDIAVTRPPDADTTDAHRLVALGLALGGPALQGAVLERLYAAVFAEGLDIASQPVLQRLAAEAGLDEHRVGDLLASTERSAEVAADIAAAADAGITGTPHLVVHHRARLGGPATVDDYLLLMAGSLGHESGGSVTSRASTIPRLV
ncbi:DsbA family protein, partial [Janibacter sp. HTCC2649]|uniref:DsbA family oxidoreductase n=1 Tax=Janibacter sp. HTCC2649 TaxID=313589 RepID=UPI0013052E09